MYCEAEGKLDKSEEVIAKPETEEKNVSEIFKEGTFLISECGNGIIEEGERCDDGNTFNGDACSYRCRIEPKKEVPVI